MQTIEPIYNAGRWMVYCPIHGREGAVLAMDYSNVDPTQSRFWTQGNEYICPICYPGITAQLQVIKKGRVINIPDKGAQATARLLARTAGAIYQVIFPDGQKQIEELLNERPKHMQNWDGRHETLEFLAGENRIVSEIVKERHVI